MPAALRALVPALVCALLVPGLAAALLAAALLVAGPSATAPTAQAAPRLAPAAAHPYSDPTWFPLRAPARVGCARSGCGTAADHGYAAIDLMGTPGDPVHAAGAGVAHVGGDSGGCSGSGEVDGGRWVWVDHGGGVVSRYHHLDAITVREGALVTPATRIGTMGRSGDVPPCTTSYLHFEVRHGGVTGERVDLGTLRGCASSGPVRLPQALGASGWDDPALHPAKRLTTPALDSGCVTADWSTTAAAPAAPEVARSAGALAVTPDLPVGATSWTLEVQIWRPSLDAWRTLDVEALPATRTRVVVTDGIEDDRRYRVRTAVHQGRGWSLWSGHREAVGRPAAPPVRYLEWKRTGSKKKSYLHFGWSRPAALGGPVRSYAVARRCGAKASDLAGWKTSRASAGSAYKNLRKLGRAKVCEVRVRAVNAAGKGDWSPTRRVTR